MTKEELLAEEHICNGKCQDDITKNYVHCKTCARLVDFLAGYNTGKVVLKVQPDFMERACDGAAEMYKDLKTAKEIIKKLHDCLLQDYSDEETRYYIIKYMTEAENFLKEHE